MPRRVVALPRRRWKQFGSMRHGAGLRSVSYALSSPTPNFSAIGLVGIWHSERIDAHLHPEEILLLNLQPHLQEKSTMGALKLNFQPPSDFVSACHCVHLPV